MGQAQRTPVPGETREPAVKGWEGKGAVVAMLGVEAAGAERCRGLGEGERYGCGQRYLRLWLARVGRTGGGWMRAGWTCALAKQW